MEERVRCSWDVLKHRWKNAMPKFFRVVFWVCALISGTALAVNTAILSAGGVTHEWWNDLYPYLIGVPAGMAFACKFTQQYHGKPIDYDEYMKKEEEKRVILDKDNF